MDIALRLIETGLARAGVERVVAHMAAMRGTLTTTAWRMFAKRAVTHSIVRHLHADPMTERAFSKPRGYAGDAVMMDMLYGVQRPAIPAAVEPITAYTTEQGVSARAVRHRRLVLARAIDHAREALGRPVAVTALACGHLRECELSRAAMGGEAVITALDQDEESLAVVGRDYPDYRIDLVAASIRQILSAKLTLPDADLVYSAGLYDYLSQPLACRLTAALFATLVPGGRLLLANFLPTLPDIGYLESFMDWHLIYRDDNQMRGLLAGLPQGDIGGVRQYHDPLDAIAYLEVVKRQA